jgi:methionyl-tRNA formyltransferase
MQMQEGLDTGPICASAETPIEAEDPAASLHDRLATLGANLLIETLAKIERGKAQATPQAEVGVSYAAKIDPAEARIDWTRSARELDLHIRGLSPAPGAWFELPGGVRAKALMSRLGQGAGAPGELLDESLLVACGEGALRLQKVQREGRAAMETADFLRGTPVPAGSRLT